MARARSLFPTEAGTAELREMEREFLRRSVFSARVTNTRFLQAVKTKVEKLLASESPDFGAARRELRAVLKSIGYKPDEPGTLKDLTSSARLNLILETQTALLSGHAQRQHGLTPSSRERAPAWEFARLRPSIAPRDWFLRWQQVGARLVTEGGVEKMIAPKNAEVWDALGDAALFDDALNVNHPPFAFNSGMGWKSVSAKRAQRLGLTADARPVSPSPLLPADTLDVSEISRPLLVKLRDALREVQAREAAPGKLRIESPPPKRRPARDAEPEPVSPVAKNQPKRSLKLIQAAQEAEFNAALLAASIPL